jgi:hypothetical protein
MSERIYKLQPDRTLSLRGFDGFGAAAALHSATPTSFTVSGVFRDPADFAVLMLHDADDFYEHPSIRYLPDFDFRGLTLTFDVAYSAGLMPLDSPKYATIDWPFLDVAPLTGDPVQVRLFDHAVQSAGQYTSASGQFTIIGSGLQQYDRVTLWYLNYAFDYMVPPVECSYAFIPKGTGFTHQVTVSGIAYSYIEKAGDSASSIAQGIVQALASCKDVTATAGAQVDIRASRDDGKAVPVSSSASSTAFTLYGVGAATVAAALASQINGVDWAHSGVALPLAASTAGNVVTVQCARPGGDGNSITMYSVSKNARLTTAENWVRFVNGGSQVTWRVTLTFSALGISSVRQMWLTFAPELSIGQALAPVEWEAAFSNWSLSGPEDQKRLRVAGPGSVRIEDDDSRCALSPGWAVQSGFYTRGFARSSKNKGDTVRVAYECGSTHDLYLGTSLYSDRGQFSVQLDGVTPPSPLDTSLSVDAEVVTRRLIAQSLASGTHTVTLTHLDNSPVYFDFLEAAVPSDIPAPLPAAADISPALDYSTDHTYKLSPERILWNFDQLGFSGPMNEYIGVFWWNQRVRSGGSIPSVSIAFSGTFVPGDQIFLEIGGDEKKNIPGQVLGKTVFPNEPAATLASHFAAFISAASVGVWAAAQDAVLTITAQSPARAYSLAFKAWAATVAGSSGSVSFTGSLQGGQEGDWLIDPSITPVLNRAARDWHAGMFAECRKRSRELTVACSMELVNPPADFPARFPDATPVETSIGFASLRSTHCAFNSAVLDYKKNVYSTIASMMDAAGLTPTLQFGEFCWWYFPSGGGMGFYDDETVSLARTALGRDLYVFQSADDDPNVNGGADALFLRNRLRDHVSSLVASVRAAYPAARFEVLFPYDVNYPHPVGVHSLGGRLLRFINFPVEWQSKQSSGFDRIKMEGLDFGAYSRNLDLALETMRFPLNFGWPKDSVRYMIPVFNGGCPWVREYRLAGGLGLKAINFWAFDHFCIFGWDVTSLGRSARAVRV